VFELDHQTGRWEYRPTPGAEELDAIAERSWEPLSGDQSDGFRADND
jgi:hypothetical protein